MTLSTQISYADIVGSLNISDIEATLINLFKFAPSRTNTITAPNQNGWQLVWIFGSCSGQVTRVCKP